MPLQDLTLTLPLAVAFAALGAFAWSLGEYVIHRFLMHEQGGRGLPSLEHLLHHADPEENPGRPLLSWFGIIVIGVAILGSAGWLLNHLWSLPLLVASAPLVGWLAGYGFYERVHNRAHTHAPRGAYGRWVRRHHFHHHHHGHPMANHGVTTPLWDRVFATLERADRIRVPRRQAMPWLVHADGALRAEYAADYELVGPATADARLAALDRARAFANLAPVAA